MKKTELKVGSKVKIKGDYSDFTDHLDGKIVTVELLEPDDTFDFNDDTILCSYNGDYWYIYLKNILEVVE